MSEFSSIAVAVVSVLGALGGAAKWTYAKVERRFERIELQLRECEAREDRGDLRRAKMWTIIEILLEALEDTGPEHRLLGRARQLLSELKRDESQPLPTLEPAE